MTRYIVLPIPVDPLQITEGAYDNLATLVPGWEPADGNLDVWILQTIGNIAADLSEIARDVPDDIFRYFGSSILGITPKTSTFAYFEATWSALDTAGYLIPAGTTVAVKNDQGDLSAFQTVDDYSIPAGQTSLAPVLLTAVEPGSLANGLSTGTVDLIDSMSWVDTIVGQYTTRGGVDGETDDEYFARMVDEIRLMSPRPILPDDFGVLAKRVDGIDRAYAVNLYKADTNTTPVERCVTVVVTDLNGEPPVTTAVTEADTLLENMSEVNQLVYVIPPEYQTVNCDVSCVCFSNYDPIAVQAAVLQALQDYISPKFWGLTVSGGTEISTYVPINIVRLYEVSWAINQVPGVDYITAHSLLLNSAENDVNLASATNPVVLPRPGTINVTVTAP
jgi:hypothetical protein